MVELKVRTPDSHDEDHACPTWKRITFREDPYLSEREKFEIELQQGERKIPKSWNVEIFNPYKGVWSPPMSCDAAAKELETTAYRLAKRMFIFTFMGKNEGIIRDCLLRFSLKEKK